MEALYGTRYDVESEITITAGAATALFTAATACVRPGDEVIVFEPVYDAYVPAIELAGGTPVRLQLAAPDYRPDWAAVLAAITPRTRMIKDQHPAQPHCHGLDAGRPDHLAALTRSTGIVVVADSSMNTSSSTAPRMPAAPPTPSWRIAAS